MTMVGCGGLWSAVFLAGGMGKEGLNSTLYNITNKCKTWFDSFRSSHSHSQLKHRIQSHKKTSQILLLLTNINNSPRHLSYCTLLYPATYESWLFAGISLLRRQVTQSSAAQPRRQMEQSSSSPLGRH